MPQAGVSPVNYGLTTPSPPVSIILLFFPLFNSSNGLKNLSRHQKSDPWHNSRSLSWNTEFHSISHKGACCSAFRSSAEHREPAHPPGEPGLGRRAPRTSGHGKPQRPLSSLRAGGHGPRSHGPRRRHL